MNSNATDDDALKQFLRWRGVRSPCPKCNGRGWFLEKDANGKIKKGAGYSEPNLEPFTAERFAETEGGAA